MSKGHHRELHTLQSVVDIVKIQVFSLYMHIDVLKDLR
jgi:hypothetical protein